MAIIIGKQQVTLIKACLFVCFFFLQVLDTSIWLPSSLFQQISLNSNVNFQFIVYSNSKLFPEITSKTETEQTAEVTSSVVSVQFGELVNELVIAKGIVICVVLGRGRGYFQASTRGGWGRGGFLEEESYFK